MVRDRSKMPVSSQVTPRRKRIQTTQFFLLFFSFIATVITSVGYFSPNWLYTRQPVGLGAYTDFGVGLVCTCGSLNYAGITKTECQTTPWAVFLGSNRVYFNAVRLLMIFSFIPLVISFFMNFIFIYTKKLYPTRVAAILTTLAGVLGVASFSTFVGWTATSTDLFAQVNYVSVQLERGWAFYLSAVGSCIILVCGGISAYVSIRHPSYTVVQKQSTGGVINAGYVMQSQQNPTSGFVFGSVGVVQPQEKIANPRQVQLI